VKIEEGQQKIYLKKKWRGNLHCIVVSQDQLRIRKLQPGWTLSMAPHKVGWMWRTEALVGWW